jgi:purine nucleosidase
VSVVFSKRAGQWLRPLCFFIVVSLSAQSDFERRLQIPSGRVSVVIDTDAHNEVDDQFAIAYALLAPERLNVEALYAAPFTNAHAETAAEGMEQSYDEIQQVLAVLDLPAERFDRAQVYRGAKSYLPTTGLPAPSPAVKDIIRRGLAEREQPLLIIALGAPTNVAVALLLEPKLIDRVTVMWLSTQPYSSPNAGDFNTNQDLRASQLMFDSGVALINISGFNVSEHLRMSIPELERYMKGRSAIGNYLYEIVYEHYLARRKHPGYPWSKPIWDIATIAMFINEEWVPSLVTHSPILTDQLTWKRDPSRHPVRVATDVIRDPVFDDLFRRLAAAGR